MEFPETEKGHNFLLNTIQVNSCQTLKYVNSVAPVFCLCYRKIFERTAHYRTTPRSYRSYSVDGASEVVVGDGRASGLDWPQRFREGSDRGRRIEHNLGPVNAKHHPVQAIGSVDFQSKLLNVWWRFSRFENVTQECDWQQLTNTKNRLPSLKFTSNETNPSTKYFIPLAAPTAWRQLIE